MALLVSIIDMCHIIVHLLDNVLVIFTLAITQSSYTLFFLKVSSHCSLIQWGMCVGNCSIHLGMRL